MPMHFLTYLAHPTESAQEFADSGGAYVNCWILNDSRQAAEELAISMIDEYGWAVDALEDAGTVTSDDYTEDDEDREFYEQALVEGEVLVFNTWPIGDEDEDDDDEEEVAEET